MVSMVEIGNPRIVAVHRQQVLCEVVGADRQEVDPAGDFRHLVDRGRHLDHGADQRPVKPVTLLLGQLIEDPVDQFEGGFQLGDVGDHGQQDTQVFVALAGPHDGP